MRYGVQWFSSDSSIDPGRLARLVEERGFESLLTTEHTHIPASEATMDRSAGGEPPPEYYRHSLDPFVSMAFAAAATKQLRIGMAVCLLAQRDPIATAKAVATLDHLSNGRLKFGVGFGWNQDEAANHEVNWRTRFSLVREKVAAMRELWNQDLASYDGRYVKLTSSWSWPKPAQRPLSVFVGGTGPVALRNAIEWGDGWMPNTGPVDPALEDAIPRFRKALVEHGREPDSMPIVATTLPPDRGILERLAAQGVSEALLALYPGSPEGTVDMLDRFVEVRESAVV
jgi:probable F420-dependent oxidoreductase